MPWTPLHAALGETSTDLTFEMIERAVVQRVVEDSSLDWKGELPLVAPKSDQKSFKDERYELAKDVAAMANSGGGMIIYGVSETKIDGRTAAGEVTGVPAVTEDHKKQIHQLAFSMVHPPVSGLELREVLPADRTDGGVLLMTVPDSQDAPHLVVQKGDGGYFQAPWRSGADTFFMTERQLADAYRRREQTRRDHDEELGELFDRFAGAVGAHRGEESPVWVVAVARPIVPLTGVRQLGIAVIDRIMAVGKRYPWVKSSTPVKEAADNGSIRWGLRLHHCTSSRDIQGRTVRARIEAHGDGSLAVGVTRDGLFGPSDIAPGNVPIDDFEKVGLDLVALILELRKIGGPASDYEIQLGITPATDSFRHPDPSFIGKYQPLDDGERVHDFRSVRGTLVASLGRQELLASVVDVISDAVNQTGDISYLDAEKLEGELVAWQKIQALQNSIQADPSR
ncbi:AlbA family DNA-binding domain-containing protein [Micrococcus terreus]|uniref:AlbA family DNA-binding domain-containing protein n=1 Tax=Micrococcus terreus TaxID=574650 RepID=UPI00254A14D4|nr:ATP-binding protein [Micrococcus terreus]MDK7700813.1 ATP-binding protein [Micrococcus terreus]WOO96969.1 ATP-binding protein [Micrococcus terreus]